MVAETNLRQTRHSLHPTLEGDYSFAHREPFQLTGGGQLQPVTLHYATYGRLSQKRDNLILVCHALSGSALAADWWPEMIGEGRALDTSRYCVVCVNVIGSCYGSTGPSSTDPLTGEPYGSNFPLVTINDIVRAQARLIFDEFSIEKLHTVIGGSIGGMQALEWAISFPERIERCISIGATPLSAMGLALNHLQRQAILLDLSCRNGSSLGDAPVAGLALARAIATCSYKSAELFAERFNRRRNRNGENPLCSLNDRFDVAGYLDYQGEKFTRRFSADSYLILAKAMDTFDLTRGGKSEEVLTRIRARVLLVGILSDWLFPKSDVQALAERMRAAGVDCSYAELRSSHGHDGFLADALLLEPLIMPLLESSELAERYISVGAP